MTVIQFNRKIGAWPHDTNPPEPQPSPPEAPSCSVAFTAFLVIAACVICGCFIRGAYDLLVYAMGAMGL